MSFSRAPAKLSEREFIAAITERPEKRFFLAFGMEDSTISDIARQMGERLGHEAERIDIDSDQLRSDPARLVDEANSYSLFGGTRFIRLNILREEGLDAIIALLEHERQGCPVIATAGNLAKTSKIRKLAESAPNALSFICYAQSEGDAVAGIMAQALSQGLKLDRTLATSIARYTSNDRKLAAMEVEKLALFHDASPEHPVVATPHAIEALSAETGEENVSALVNQIMGGNIRLFGKELVAARDFGIDAIRIIRALQRRVALLAGMRSKIDDGALPEPLVRGTHAVFFLERGAVIEQLRRWPSTKLAGLNGHLLEIEQKLMSVKAETGTIILGQELSRIARMAARAR
jgi:DNA polymerase III subunit delta